MMKSLQQPVQVQQTTQVLQVQQMIQEQVLVPPLVTLSTSLVCHPERSEGSVYFPRLSLVLLLGCHPERSEGSGSMGSEMLRGVYPECNEWAQHDSDYGLPTSSPGAGGHVAAHLDFDGHGLSHHCVTEAACGLATRRPTQAHSRLRLDRRLW
jgi:hypothetical protein